MPHRNGHDLWLFIRGCVILGFGMVPVMAPIFQFLLKASVPKGKAFVHATRPVVKGTYDIVRHPQDTGGMFAMFLTTVY